MKLGEFIKNFSYNNLIRLHYKSDGGHICVLDSFDEVSMDWEVLRGVDKNRHYIDNEVLGLIGIYHNGRYPDAINIVIEKLENQPFIEDNIVKNVTSESLAV